MGFSQRVTIQMLRLLASLFLLALVVHRSIVFAEESKSSREAVEEKLKNVGDVAKEKWDGIEKEVKTNANSKERPSKSWSEWAQDMLLSTVAPMKEQTDDTTRVLGESWTHWAKKLNPFSGGRSKDTTETYHEAKVQGSKVAEDASDVAGSVSSKAGEQLSGVKDKISESVPAGDDVLKSSTEKVKEAQKKVEDVATESSEKVEEGSSAAYEEAKEKVRDAYERSKETASKAAREAGHKMGETGGYPEEL